MWCFLPVRTMVEHGKDVFGPSAKSWKSWWRSRYSTTRAWTLLCAKQWRQVQYLADVFWRRWVREYLLSLQKWQKWNKKQRNFAKDDIVLVHDDNKPHSFWPLGRIMEVYTNHNDGLVRSVKLKTSTSDQFTRSCYWRQLLCQARTIGNKNTFYY